VKVILFLITGALIPWLIRKTFNPEESITEIPLPVSTGCTHEESFSKIEDLKGLPFNVEKWICVKDERKKVKLLQRAQHIYACRNKTGDKEKVFNFGILTSLKSEFCGQEQGSKIDNDLVLWKTIIIIKSIHAMFLIKKGCLIISLLLQE
jgi:hypothetical protein